MTKRKELEIKPDDWIVMEGLYGFRSGKVSSVDEERVFIFLEWQGKLDPFSTLVYRTSIPFSSDKAKVMALCEELQFEESTFHDRHRKALLRHEAKLKKIVKDHEK